MSDRERWILYPLVLMSLGISLRDKVLPSSEVIAMKVRCNDLEVSNGMTGKSLTADYVRSNLVEANRGNIQELTAVEAEVNKLKLKAWAADGAAPRLGRIEFYGAKDTPLLSLGLDQEDLAEILRVLTKDSKPGTSPAPDEK